MLDALDTQQPVGVDLTELPDMSAAEPIQVYPTGYHLLLWIPPRDEKTATGIYRPDEYRLKEQVASVLAKVIEVGPDAFKDKDHFPSGESWCKAGDIVLIHSYSGSRFQVRHPDGVQHEYRILEDRHVLAVVAEEFADKVDRINAA